MNLGVMIDYVNWRGERTIRMIKPLSIRWGKTRWHPEAQYLLRALDCDKNEIREFAMKDIHSWAPAD